MSEPTRGERNKNPGNLNFIDLNPWQGQVGIEIVPEGKSYPPRFGRYDSDANGIRAVGKQLLAYQNHHDCKSVRDLVYRWAPPTENNASSYVKDVAAMLGVEPDTPINLNDASILAVMVRGIIRHENGRCLYDALMVAAAARSALA